MDKINRMHIMKLHIKYDRACIMQRGSVLWPCDPIYSQSHKTMLVISHLVFADSEINVIVLFFLVFQKKNLKKMTAIVCVSFTCLPIVNLPISSLGYGCEITVYPPTMMTQVYGNHFLTLYSLQRI